MSYVTGRHMRHHQFNHSYEVEDVIGMVKLVFARDDLTVLGVHVVGDAATELVHQGQAVIHFRGTIEYFIHTTFNVPTMSEAYKYAAYDGLRQVGR